MYSKKYLSYRNILDINYLQILTHCKTRMNPLGSFKTWILRSMTVYKNGQKKYGYIFFTYILQNRKIKIKTKLILYIRDIKYPLVNWKVGLTDLWHISVFENPKKCI